MPTREQVYAEAVYVLRSEGHHDADLHEDYSGRGMHGQTCPAISSKAPGVVVGWAIAVAYATLFAHGSKEPSVWSALEYMPMRSDSLGLGTIWY